jgi:hypothetical protein
VAADGGGGWGSLRPGRAAADYIGGQIGAGRGSSRLSQMASAAGGPGELEVRSGDGWWRRGLGDSESGPGGGDPGDSKARSGSSQWLWRLE